MSIQVRLFSGAALLSLVLLGCGGAESTGHTDDPTPGGDATPAVEEMDADYAKNADKGN